MGSALWFFYSFLHNVYISLLHKCHQVVPLGPRHKACPRLRNKTRTYYMCITCSHCTQPKGPVGSMCAPRVALLWSRNSRSGTACFISALPTLRQTHLISHIQAYTCRIHKPCARKTSALVIKQHVKDNTE